MEVDWKSFGSHMEVVGSGLEVDVNFHALPWKFPLWQLVQASEGSQNGSKVEAYTAMHGGGFVQLQLSFYTP